MSYFDELKKTIIDKCIFKYVESENSTYFKEMTNSLNDFTYSEFSSYEPIKAIEPEIGTLIQKEMVVLDGNNVLQLTEELLRNSHYTDAQMITRALSIYFFQLVKQTNNISPTTIASHKELTAEMNKLVKYDYSEVSMLLDLQNLANLKRNQLDGLIENHKEKYIHNRYSYDFFFPVIFTPRLGIKDILVFNKDYTFCYSDLSFRIENNKMILSVKIAIQNMDYLKLLSF